VARDEDLTGFAAGMPRLEVVVVSSDATTGGLGERVGEDFRLAMENT
jgi:hypothetical protein